MQILTFVSIHLISHQKIVQMRNLISDLSAEASNILYQCLCTQDWSSLQTDTAKEDNPVHTFSSFSMSKKIRARRISESQCAVQDGP